MRCYFLSLWYLYSIYVQYVYDTKVSDQYFSIFYVAGRKATSALWLKFVPKRYRTPVASQLQAPESQLLQKNGPWETGGELPASSCHAPTDRFLWRPPWGPSLRSWHSRTVRKWKFSSAAQEPGPDLIHLNNWKDINDLNKFLNKWEHIKIGDYRLGKGEEILVSCYNS